MRLQDLLPHVGRAGSWMVFIDGENLAMSGKRFAGKRRLELHTGSWYEPNVFLWLPEKSPSTVLHCLLDVSLPTVERAYYYTSFKGSDKERQGVRRRIRDAGFDPKVFPRTKSKDSKGVDISMARDVLSHAFDENYDACLLIAGDGDYIPLVEEVKRRGRHVVVSFFEADLNEDLRIEADRFVSLEPTFITAWTEHLYPRMRGAMLPCVEGHIAVGLFAKREANGLVGPSVRRVEFEKDRIKVECFVRSGPSDDATQKEVDRFLRDTLSRAEGSEAESLRACLRPAG